MEISMVDRICLQTSIQFECAQQIPIASTAYYGGLILEFLDWALRGNLGRSAWILNKPRTQLLKKRD